MDKTITTIAINKIRAKEGYLDQTDEYFLIAEIQNGNHLAFEVLEEKFAKCIDLYAARYFNNLTQKNANCPKMTHKISFSDIKAECHTALWFAAMKMDFSRGTRLATFLQYKLSDHLRAFVYEENGSTMWKGKTDHMIEYDMSCFINAEDEKINSIPDNNAATELEKKETSLALGEALKKITGKDKDILSRYFGLAPYNTAQSKAKIEKATGMSLFLINKSLNSSLETLKKELGDTASYFIR